MSEKMKTGLEEYFIIKDNKKMRYGYTTGSCAAGAAGAAARMLLGGKPLSYARLMTPRGIELTLTLLDVSLSEEKVSCAIRKDGGDDPDATTGLLVYASVKKCREPGIHIDGGRGVGRVTQKGLEQPVGAAAINKVPRQMIEQEVEKACDEFSYEGGIQVIISIQAAKKWRKRPSIPDLALKEVCQFLEPAGLWCP